MSEWCKSSKLLLIFSAAPELAFPFYSSIQNGTRNGAFTLSFQQIYVLTIVKKTWASANGGDSIYHNLDVYITTKWILYI
jgi:hypothetical protein